VFSIEKRVNYWCISARSGNGPSSRTHSEVKQIANYVGVGHDGHVIHTGVVGVEDGLIRPHALPPRAASEAARVYGAIAVAEGDLRLVVWELAHLVVQVSIVWTPTP